PCIPHRVEKRKEEILEARDAEVTPCPQTCGGMVTCAWTDFHPPKDQTEHKSAPRLPAHEASNTTPNLDSRPTATPGSVAHATAARRNTPPRPCNRPSMTWGFQKTSWPRSKGACGANRSCWAKFVGSCFPRCLGAAPSCTMVL